MARMERFGDDRLFVLDGVRGVAALAVALFHLSGGAPLEISGLRLLQHGEAAVDLFFMLSGFVIAQSYTERLTAGMAPQTYLLRRAVRLYPLFFLGALAGGAALALLQRLGDAELARGALLRGLGYNLLWLPFPNADAIRSFGAAAGFAGEIFPANPPAWSLFFEGVASFAFLFLYRWSATRLLKLALLAGAAFLLFALASGLSGGLVWLNAALGWTTSNFFGGFPRVLFGFTLGMWLRQGSGGLFLAPAKLLARGGTFAVCAAAALALAAPMSFHGLYVAAVIAVAAPVIVLAGASIVNVEGVSANLARRLGALSYPLYCLHFPIGRAVWASGERQGWPPMACVGAGLVLSLVAAQIALVVFDAPVRRVLTGALGLGAETRGPS